MHRLIFALVVCFLLDLSCARAAVFVGLGSVDEIDGVDSASATVSWETGQTHPWEILGGIIRARHNEHLRTPRVLFASLSKRFTWKGLLDFTSCTECGRCQSQCPAWATGKPLSPKLLVMGLREHAYAKAPWLQAAESARADLPEAVRLEAERPLVGVGAPEAAAQAHGGLFGSQVRCSRRASRSG